MVELLCFAPDFKLDKATVQFLILSSNGHVYNVSSLHDMVRPTIAYWFLTYWS